MQSQECCLVKLPISRAAYSDRTAWFLARCSELAYLQFESGQEPELRAELKELGLEFVQGFSREATCAFLACNDRFAVLVFRGIANDYRNILTDMDVRFRRDKFGAKITNGFSAAYQRLEEEIDKALAGLAPDLPLYVAGHSLGGALAVIASIRIWPSDRIAACYTYGCPRVRKAEYDVLRKTPVYRQVLSSDIMARLPFGFGYGQAGDLRYIKRSGTLVKDPNPIGPFFSFLWSFVTNSKRKFENHRIASYVDRLHARALHRLRSDRDLGGASGWTAGPGQGSSQGGTVT